MTPGARVQAAIDCLDTIFAGTAAEKTLTGWARRSRFAGSKDRAAVRDHVFDVLRGRDTMFALGGGTTGRAAMIGLMVHQGASCETVFTGDGHAPDPLTENERQHVSQVLTHDIDDLPFCWDMPQWCARILQADHGDSAAPIATSLRQRAPVDLRVNVRRSTLGQARAALASEGIAVEPVSLSPWALRVTQGSRKIRQSRPFSDGLIELQDAGSQALVANLPLRDGMRILDYCAGGGGKSLAMAAAARIEVFAHDANPNRMRDIAGRSERAGARITCLSPDQLGNNGPYDLVICDVPCSGSGAWRRAPDAKWRFSEPDFKALLDVQSSILATASHLVAPGGVLAYATCSLFAAENEQQVKAFLSNQTNMSLILQKSWTPLDGCDGFHLSILG